MKAAPVAWLAIEPDLSAVLLYQAAGNRQPEPGTLAHALGGGRHLAEGIENGLVLSGGDPDPGVSHYRDDISIIGSGFNPDAAPLGSELEGVTKQVVENLLEPHA